MTTAQAQEWMVMEGTCLRASAGGVMASSMRGEREESEK